MRTWASQSKLGMLYVGNVATIVGQVSNMIVHFVRKAPNLAH